MLTWLSGCPALGSVFAFQAGMAGDGTTTITTEYAQGRGRAFIDGSYERTFDLVIAFYKSLIAGPYVAAQGTANKNLGDIVDAQSMIDWIDAQTTMPNFGAKCAVDRVYALTDEPVLAWIDSEQYEPPLAKYTITVRVEYIDYTRAI